MNWHDGETYIEIFPPQEFNYDECLVFLGRSNKEVLYQIREQMIYKLLKVDQTLVLFRIKFQNNVLYVDFPLETPDKDFRIQVVNYIWEWFDFDFELSQFKKSASGDDILGPISSQYDGLRIICIPDLFEALTWAIIGQQINLTFAYTLKKRFVEVFGESLMYNGETFWCFPTYEKIAAIELEDLTELQFSKRKAEYVIGIANIMATEELSKIKLLEMNDYTQMKETLIRLRGIGAWTADYVLMKCFHQPDAFPISDVGLHQALKQQLELNRKPTIQEIEEIAVNWKGYKAYAVFYLWRSLYGTS
ncbi:DNA-3-methyladenine glycosylase family protein [Bacillus suaedaesalsae]|uniref:DNA-3-methyladenine glycosylase II n=1 Tax=Bacillus suaedaesalsae TaxID=2810349 RepID=A0ABS2DEK6_9BACI|nr:DNA-3-methyladenine glycosylase [Bacillus suaedaesalsae]MBM6616892.1 DNA-3-methyladenine glycosylase 2 family protein [Bacillus suaedaesalsae]